MFITEVSKFYSGLWEIRDRRVDEWPLMSSPWPTVALSALYVYSVVSLGPRFMRKREAYNPKPIMMAYNLFQIILSAYIVYEASMAGWFTSYNWGMYNFSTRR